MAKSKKKKTSKKRVKKEEVSKQIPVIRPKTKKIKSNAKYGNPLSIILYLIGIIVIIYGAWFRELLWVLLGFVPVIIGIWWAHIIKNE